MRSRKPSVTANQLGSPDAFMAQDRRRRLADLNVSDSDRTCAWLVLEVRRIADLAAEKVAQSNPVGLQNCAKAIREAAEQLEEAAAIAAAALRG